MKRTEAEAIVRRLELAAEDAARTVRAIRAGGGLRRLGLSVALANQVERAARELERSAPRAARIAATRLDQLEDDREPEGDGGAGDGAGAPGAPGAPEAGTAAATGDANQEGGAPGANQEGGAPGDTTADQGDGAAAEKKSGRK